jgi:hypothetical protein
VEEEEDLEDHPLGEVVHELVEDSIAVEVERGDDHPRSWSFLMTGERTSPRKRAPQVSVFHDPTAAYGDSLRTQRRKRSEAEKLRMAAKHSQSIKRWASVARRRTSSVNTPGSPAARSSGAAAASNARQGGEDDEVSDGDGGVRGAVPVSVRSDDLDSDEREGSDSDEREGSDSDSDSVASLYESPEATPLVDHPRFAETLRSLDELRLDILSQPWRSFLADELGIDDREWRVLTGVRNLLLCVESGESEEAASSTVARGMYGRVAPRSYRARVLRACARAYLETRAIPLRLQGKHVKVASLFYDEDIVAAVHDHVASIINDRQRVSGFKAENVVTFVTQTYGTSISVATAKRLLHRMGFHQAALGSAAYVDGHERDDVKAHRDEYVKIMMNDLLPRTMQYENNPGGLDGELVPVLPQLLPVPALLGLPEREVVLVFHDESTFYAMEGTSKVWASEGSALPRPKHKGASVMVSGFITQDGFFHATDEMRSRDPTLPPHSYVFFEPGKQREGWWSNKDLVAQLLGVMKLFRACFPTKRPVFIFDNSSNHRAAPPGALDATAFNKNIPKKVDLPMRHGWVDVAGPEPGSVVRAAQNMMATANELRPLVDVLQERGLSAVGTKDELVALLAAQPDFKAQKGWLEEVVRGEGFEIMFLPKFHCELNPIERVWGHAKRKLRTECDYTSKSIADKLPGILNNIPRDSVRRYYRAVARFVHAYEHGLTTQQAAFVVKRYASHRRVPDSAWSELER